MKRKAAALLDVPQQHHWTVPSELSNINPVVASVVVLCERAGFSAKQCRLNLPVAITEAIANAILRANRNGSMESVDVWLSFEGDCVVVDVDDQGAGFDVSSVVEGPDDADWLTREDGRGVFLMRQLMDRVESHPIRNGRGHRLRLMLHKT